MSLTISVIPGTTVSDGVPISAADLNALGLPTVQLTGTVGGTEIALGGVNYTHVSPGPLMIATTTGSASAYVAAPSPALVSLTNNAWFIASPNHTNTGASTLNVSSLGAKKVLKAGGTELIAGDLTSGSPALLVYQTAADGGTGAWILAGSAAAPAIADSRVTPGAIVAAVTTGSASAYVAAPDPALPAFKDLAWLIVRPNHTNTGAATLNVNGLGAKKILSASGALLVAGQIATSAPILLMYSTAADSAAGAWIALAGLVTAPLYGVNTGTDNAMAVTVRQSTTTLADLVGVLVTVGAVDANTAAVTLAVNGLAATAVLQADDRQIPAGGLAAGAKLTAVYDGTVFRVVSGINPDKVVTLTSATGGVEIDWDKGTNFHLLLTEDTLASFANADEGREIRVVVKQSAGTVWTFDFPTCKWDLGDVEHEPDAANRYMLYRLVAAGGDVLAGVVRNMR